MVSRGDESKATALWLSSPLRPPEKEMKEIAQSKCVSELERVLRSRVYRRVWEGLRRVQEPGCEQAGGIMGRNVKCQESVARV